MKQRKFLYEEGKKTDKEKTFALVFTIVTEENPTGIYQSQSECRTLNDVSLLQIIQDSIGF